MKKFSPCFFLLFFLVLAGPARAMTPGPDSCGCTGADFSTRWKKATTVFTGTVQGITNPQKFVRQREADPPTEVTLTVQETYKGGAEKTFVLNTSQTHYTCTGFPFEVGKQYLVFAYERKDGTYTPQSLYKYPVGTFDVNGLCGGTKEFSQAAADAKLIALEWKDKLKGSLLSKLVPPPEE
jgi:hypothetical protein